MLLRQSLYFRILARFVFGINFARGTRAISQFFSRIFFCGFAGFRGVFLTRVQCARRRLFFCASGILGCASKVCNGRRMAGLCSRARKLRSLKRAARERFAAGGDAPKRGGCGSAYRAMRTLCGVFAICPNSGSQCYCGLVGGRQGKIRVGKRGCLRGSYALVYGGEILRRFCGVFFPRGSRGCAAPQSA